MNRFFAAVVATAITATAAAAQDAPKQTADFTGDCKAFTKQGEVACTASGWCRWTNRKEITLPNGVTFKPEGFCAFKAGHKQAWSAGLGKQ